MDFIVPWGSLVNAGCIILGTFAGLFLGKKMSTGLRDTVFTGLGLATLAIGIKMSLETGSPLIVTLSVVAGGIAGHILGLEEKLGNVGNWLKKKVHLKSSTFTEGFVAASVLFCVGSLAILGAFDEGLRGDRTLLFTKSLLDGFASMVFAATYGIGVAFSAIPVLLYQGGLTEFSMALEPVVDQRVMQEITAVGGVLILGIGLNLLNLKQIPLTNFLPALFFAPFLLWVTGLIMQAFGS